MKSNGYINIHEGRFESKMALDNFKAGLSPEIIVIKERKIPDKYDSWDIIYWQPDSLI